VTDSSIFFSRCEVSSQPARNYKRLRSVRTNNWSDWRMLKSLYVSCW